MKRIRVHTAAVITLGFLAGACRPSANQYAALDAWLLCDECVNGERATVRAIGSLLVHTLDQALVGPSPGRVANKVTQFRQAYRALPAPVLSESAYVAAARSNYIARYQQRAALSLGDIGTRRARQALHRALDSAVARDYRADVVDVIETVVARSETEPFAGSAGPSIVPFGDTVRVRRGGGLSWDGDESVVLHGAPVPDSVVVARWGNDSLAFVAAAPMGDHAVSVTGLGAQEDTQSFRLQIVAPAYRTHTADSAPLLTAAPFPQTHYVVLPAGPADTIDFFRLTPAAELVVTAHVLSGADISLRWFQCAPRVLMPGPSGTVTGSIVDQTGAPFGSATINVVGTATSTVASGSGRFSVLFPPTPIVRLRVLHIGYGPQTYAIQTGADTVRIGLVATSTPYRAALTRQSSTVTIPAGRCRLLQVGATRNGSPRVIRVRLTTP